MKAEFTDFSTTSNWVKGTVAEFKFDAKLFDIPSEWGIDGGRVSKLSIREDGKKAIVNFDRGWDIEPSTVMEKTVYNEVMRLLATSPRRWYD